MSSLWTPGGEHPVDRKDSGNEQQEPRRATSARPQPGRGPSEEFAASEEDETQMAARLDELRRQLVSTPVEVVVANHAYGMFELAAIHLSEKPPRLDAARLAIDAMASLVDGLEGRLGEPEVSLRDALAQIRLAYVQIGGAGVASNGAAEESATEPGVQPDDDA
jgi:hypothetical protein